MIWQLMRRDRLSVGFTVLFGIIFGCFAAVSASLPVPAIQPSREAFRIASATGVGVGMGFPIFIVFVVQSQRTLYQAALPILWRDVWLSRALSLLVAAWLPLMAAAAFGLTPLPLFEAASIFTVLILAGTYLRMHHLGSRQRPLNAGFRIAILALMFGPLVAKQLKRSGWFVWPSPGIVLSACGVVSAIILWHAWRSIS